LKLNESFYQRKDVTLIARELLGKVLYSRIGKQVTSGVIVETEAYSHTEKGCHAYLNKMTKRNEVMFNAGGYAYVYLCYGIHNLFNVVTGSHGTGDAVLIRALEPVKGSLNGIHLTGSEIWIENTGQVLSKKQVVASKRIGIDYAGNDADLPWRYTIEGNEWVSK
jgi:DNA-3-methyladenine glycosylase